MSIEKLKRVMWRLKDKPLKETNSLGHIYQWLSLKEVEKAIMHEIGTDRKTIKENIKHLLKLGYLKRLNRHQFQIEEGAEL